MDLEGGVTEILYQVFNTRLKLFQNVVGDQEEDGMKT